jgi:predicted transcriptional regulator
MKEFLDLEIRRKIYTLIEKNPGLHSRKISELLSLSGQLTDYHLLYLERRDTIISIKESDEGFRRYFIKGKLGVIERRRIGLLQHEVPLKIVLFLLQHPYSKHSEILDYIGIAKSTLSYHLKRLINRSIIEEHPLGRDKTYTVVNEKEIIDILLRYKPYKRVESLKDTWADLKWPGVP